MVGENHYNIVFENQASVSMLSTARALALMQFPLQSGHVLQYLPV